MDPSEDISDSVRAYVSKAITMETEENAIDHQGRLNVDATHEHTGLEGIKKTLNTSKLIAKSTSIKHDGNCNDSSDNINQELEGGICKFEKVLDHAAQSETESSSYQTSKVTDATIHKEHFNDYSAIVLAERAANTMAQKDFEVAEQNFAKKPLSVATVPAEVYQEMEENFQTRNEVEKAMAVVASTRSRKESTSNQSVLTSNEVIVENSSKMSQNEDNASSFPTIDFSKLTKESPNILASPRNNKGLIGQLAADPSGKKITYSDSNSHQTSNSRLINHQESESLSTANQNEPLPITTPPVLYEDELGSDQTNKSKLIQKHSNKNQHDCGFIQKNGSAESLASLSRKLVLEIMELQHQTLKNNSSHNGEVQIKPKSIKAQSAKVCQREKPKTEASDNQSVDIEHMDFATARKQWLKLEAISRTHSHRSAVREQKNKMMTTHVIKEKKDDPSINNSTINEVTCPHSGSLFSEDNVQSKRSTGTKTDEVDCLRKSTNPNQEQAMVTSQKNNGIMGDLDQNLLSNVTDCSPCPEGNDSGLDDWTHRLEDNNLPDPVFQNEPSRSLPVVCETPIEREIRLSLKREESLRKARGITKLPCSEKYVQIKTRPLKLQPVLFSSSSKVKYNQFAEMQMQREMLLERQREEDLIQEGKIMGKHDENTIPEIEERRKFFEQQNPFPFPFPNKMLSPPINTPATLLVSTPVRRSPFSNETKVSNVVILPNDLLTSEKGKAEVGDAVLQLRYSNAETANVVILETPNLIIQRSSCFPLSSNSLIQREDTLQHNPFFKLRSHGGQSIISQEIREVLQREDELHKQRCNLRGMARASEESLESSTAADNLPSGHKSNKNSSQECPGTALGDC